MTDPVPVLRRACDRCHAQKLSCHRNQHNQDGPCARCIKANATCFSSPSMRHRRPGGPHAKRHRNNASVNSLTSRPTSSKAPAPSASTEIGNSSGAPDYVTKSAEAAEATETTDELMSSPTEALEAQNPYPFSDGIETVDWMDGLSSQSMFASLRYPAVGWGAAPSGASAGTLSTMPGGLQASASAAEPEPGMESFCGFQPFGDILGYGLKSHVLTSDAIADTGIMSPSRTSSALTSTSSGPSRLSSAERLNSAPADRPLPTLSPFISGVGDKQQGQQQPRRIQTDGQWLQKLVEINVQLFNHANEASNPTTTPPDTPDENHGAESVPKPHATSFDETFMLSLHFVQVLRQLDGSKSNDLISHPASTATPRLDPGSTLIIYSCYIRVLELLTARFDAIRGALQTATAATSSSRDGTTSSSNLKDSCAALSNSLPTLTACSCPLTEFPILHLRMTMELADEILDVMSALLGPILRGAGDGGQRGEEVSQQALLTREEAAYQVIKDLRREIKSSRRSMI